MTKDPIGQATTAYLQVQKRKEMLSEIGRLGTTIRLKKNTIRSLEKSKEGIDDENDRYDISDKIEQVHIDISVLKSKRKILVTSLPGQNINDL